MASSHTDASDATVGTDFALQSGGAAHESKLQRKGKMGLSRQASLGSMLSGLSGRSDNEGPNSQNANATSLSTLNQENLRPNPENQRTAAGLVTPRASSNNVIMPSDIAGCKSPETLGRNQNSLITRFPSKTSNI